MFIKQKTKKLKLIVKSAWVLSVALLMRLETQIASAQEKGPDSTAIEGEATREPDEKTTERFTSADVRTQKKWGVGLHYTYPSLLIPGAKGVDVEHFPSAQHNIALRYSKASFGFSAANFDIGELAEMYVTVSDRNFFNFNSFYWSYGLGYRKRNIHLGDQVLKYVAPGSLSLVQNVAEFHAIVVDTGIGNRWMWKNGLSLGAEWFATQFAVIKLKEKAIELPPNVEKIASKATDSANWILRDVPSFQFLKLTVGYSF